jgi:hypothetical protein
VSISRDGAASGDALLTLHHDNGGESSEMEQTIPPGEQMWMNLAELIRNRVPDRKGNTLPVDVSAVTYDLQDLTSRSHSLTASALAVDSSLGLRVRHNYPICCGNSSPDWGVDSFNLAVDDVSLDPIYATDSCNGGTVDISGLLGDWWSGNTSIATVTNTAVTGEAAGTTTANASGVIFLDGCFEDPVHLSNPVSVLSATVSLNASGQVSATDGASTLYKGVAGSLNLGIMAGQLGVNNACFGGNELVGTVQPSTSTGPVTVKRTLVTGGCYEGSTAVSCGIANGADDTETLIETNPQNVTPGGSANGHVYNLDTPGVTDPLATTPDRVRYNFTAYAVGPDGVTQISPNLSYYVVISCIQGSSGIAELSTGVSGDNQIGLGTTKTSWNLQ